MGDRQGARPHREGAEEIAAPADQQESGDAPGAGAPPRRAGQDLLIREAVAGAAASVAALGAGELTAAVFSAAASPLLAVGSLAIDLTPPVLKSAVIGAFGTGDKPFLIVVLTVVVLALGAFAGLLQARRPPLGMLLPAVAGLIAASAAVTRTGASVADAAPSVVAAVVGAALVGRLVRRSAVTGRRSFLIGAGIWAALGAAGLAFGRSVSSKAQDTAAAIRRIRLPASSNAVEVPAGTSLDVRGITPLISPNADFYRIDIALSPPALDPADWRLEVTGEVEAPFSLTYEQLSALPMSESITTLTCVSNPVGGDLAGTAVWLGTPIRDLLERARPKAGADMVLSSGADGFSASSPLSVLLEQDRNAVLAVGMNGAVLPQLHGFPVRMVVPGLYGYVSATKWLTRLEVTRFDRQTAYWTTRGYSEQAPVKLASRIDVPLSGAPAGMVTVAGVAWAQHTGIGRVQLQVDDGPWRDCALAEELSIDTWRQWRFRWQATAGSHSLRVRATDKDGVVQTAAVQGEAPNGATGLHTVNVTVP